MAKFLCHYRALDGTEMPVVLEGDWESVHSRFEHSVTPLVWVIRVGHENVGECRKILTDRLEGADMSLAFSVCVALERLS